MRSEKEKDENAKVVRSNIVLPPIDAAPGQIARTLFREPPVKPKKTDEAGAA